MSTRARDGGGEERTGILCTIKGGGKDGEGGRGKTEGDSRGEPRLHAHTRRIHTVITHAHTRSERDDEFAIARLFFYSSFPL